MADAILLLVLLVLATVIGMTTFACIQVTHAHNRRLREMAHRHYLEKSNHQQMIENEKRNR